VNITVREVLKSVGRWGLRDLEPLAAGLEFSTFRAVGPGGDPVVVRVPLGGRYQSNANDPHVDTRALLVWEDRVTRYLAGNGIPVAGPVRLVLGEPDALISRYVPDDGGDADPVGLGALLARLHRLPPPPDAPVAAGGLPLPRLLPNRIGRRWHELALLVPDLPPRPSPARLAALLAGRPGGSLLHMDVRAANLRTVGGTVLALLDWSNALVGDPALELARLTEFARLPDNGLDVTGVLAGYGPAPDPDDPAFLVYRLDAAVMLAVVFVSETPDPVRGPQAVERLVSVHQQLRSRLT
jgi:hypothetical protein